MMNREAELQDLRAQQSLAHRRGGKTWDESDEAKRIGARIRQLEQPIPTNAEVRRTLGPNGR